MKCLPGMCFLEGYGLTETTGGVTLTEPGGTGVGRVIDGVEVRLTPVEGFGEGQGEVEVRGGNVTIGYWDKSRPTGVRHVTDKAGWFKTGDVGFFPPGERGMKIVGRVKDSFKLSQGEVRGMACLSYEERSDEATLPEFGRLGASMMYF